MEEFVRRNSKVWWGNFNENNNTNDKNDDDDDTEEEEDTNNWHLNVKNCNDDDDNHNGNESDRGSLSSPESHRSQDSGFSDSETNSPTTNRVPINTSLNKSPKNKVNDNSKIDQNLLEKCEIINVDETVEEVLIDNNKTMDIKTLKKVTTSYPLKDIKNTILQNGSSTNSNKQRNFLTTKNKNYDELRQDNNDNDFEDDLTFFEEKNENKIKFNHVVKELKITLQENVNYNKKNKTLPNTVNKKNKYPSRNTSLPYFNDDIFHDEDDDDVTKEELSSIDQKDFLSLPLNCNNNDELIKNEISIENNYSLENSNTDLTNCDNNLNTNGTKPKFKLNTNSNKKINDLNRSLERTRLRSSQINEITIHRLFLRNDPNRSLEQTRILRSQRENDYELFAYNKRRKNIKENYKEIDYYEVDEDEEETGEKEDVSSFDSSFCRTEETAKFVGDIISNNSHGDNNNKNNFNCNDNNSSTWSIPGPPEYCSTPKSCSSNNTKKLPTGEDLTKNKLTPQKLNFNEPNENSYYENKNQSTNNYHHQLPHDNHYNNNNNNNDYDVEIIDYKPLNHWLKEIRYLYEPECMTTLQSKSLTADLNSQVTIMAAVTTEAVRTLQFRTKLISTEFSKLYRQVESGVLDHVGPLVQSLVGHVMEFLDTCNTSTSDQRLLIKTCEKLRSVATCSKPDQRLLANETTNLGKAFTECVDSLLLEQVKILVAVLDEPSSPLLLLTALSCLTGLGLEGQHLSQLVARCSSGIRSILTICLDSRNVSVRTAALRTLATVCCSSHTIRQLEQAGGIEILAEILQDDGRSEMELSEAVSVIVQITAPWIEDNHTVVGLTQQLTPLVSSITRIINNTTSSSALLLCAAALCHLSQLEPQCIWTMLENSSAGTLLLAIRRQGPFAPVFLREQAAGLLANMTAVPEARSHLAEHRAVVALLCFLQVRHSPLQSSAEVAASERLQHRSAIALSRICTDPAVAAQVVELQGVNRLVRLCREENERNHSDGVLVACLAALRKIVANCGTKSVEELNALELVEPRLLDSFLIYSSRQESYV